MTEKTTATRYAASLIDTVPASEHAALKRAAQELSTLITTTDLQAVFASPMVRAQDKQAVISTLVTRMDMGRALQGLLHVCTTNNRLNALPAILDRVVALVDKQNDALTAHVTSASPLTDSDSAALTAALAKRTGKSVTLETKTDASLIGGVVVTLDSLQIDDSIKTKLERLRRHLVAAA